LSSDLEGAVRHLPVRAGLILVFTVTWAALRRRQQQRNETLR
jgi:hypothetical protein